MLETMATDLKGPYTVLKMITALHAKEYLRRWTVYLSFAVHVKQKRKSLSLGETSIARFSAYDSKEGYHGGKFTGEFPFDIIYQYSFSSIVC
jgi:hypothetical protein